MSSWPPTKYKITDWSAYNEALKRRGDPDLSDDEGALWHAVTTNDGVRAKPDSLSAWTGRCQTSVPCAADGVR